jgi:hypothetical protein
MYMDSIQVHRQQSLSLSGELGTVALSLLARCA